MDSKERAAYKQRLIKSLKEKSTKLEPAPEQEELELENEPPEGEYADNPAYSDKTMESAYKNGGPAVRGRMQELQDMRREDVNSKREKLARYRKAWRNMKPAEEND